jgi:hypothetical protein
VVGWLVVVGTVIAYITGIAAVRRLSAAIGATIASLEVVASVIIAWWLLGQSLGPFQLLGGALVLSGALSAQLAVARTRSVEPGEARPGGSEPDRSKPVGVELGRADARQRAHLDQRQRHRRTDLRTGGPLKLSRPPGTYRLRGSSDTFPA